MVATVNGEPIHPSTPSRIFCFLATAGGFGYLPVAPGTWGSLAGILPGALLARSTNVLGSLIILAVTFVCCAFICTKAERALNQHDPSVVVLDEAWAMCAITAMFPLAQSSLRWLAVAFLLFRLFDVMKIPPLKRLALLPAGWGIMADDLGAAMYALLVLRIAAGLIG